MYDEAAQMNHHAKEAAIRLTCSALGGGALRSDDAEAFLLRMFVAVLGAPPSEPASDTIKAEEVTISPRDARKSIGKDSITCLICGAKMTVLTKHLKDAHKMEAKEYKAKFGLPKTQSLCSRNLSEAKRAQAATLNLSQHLTAARAVKAAKKPVKKSQSKARTPAAPAAQTPDLGLG